MGMMEAIAAALRGHKGATPDAPVKGALGQDGMAGQMNGNMRDAYNMYVEDETTAGREPMPFAQWYAQKKGQQ